MSIAAARVVVFASIDIVMMMITAALVHNGAVMMVIAGMFVGWSVVAVAMAFMISTNANCHTSRTNINVLGNSGCGDCDRKTKNQSYQHSIFHTKSS